jgi:antitoxin component YwqK of YwqJK toxin-antitoxin module
MSKMRTTYFMLLALGLLVWTSCGEDKESENTDSDSTVQEHSSPVKKVEPITDGPYKEYHPDGGIRIEGEMKNGTRFGLWKSYYPDGTKQSEDYFEDGKKNGKTATFYKNGHVRYIGYFTWDKPSGNWEFFDSTGTLVKKQEYK